MIWAALVALTRRAGGLIMGKTVTTEFANRYPGKTHHPQDPARTPGGSSSGSGASVAARMVYGALGSDTGGALCIAANWPREGLQLRGDALPLALVQPWLPPNEGRRMYLRGLEAYMAEQSGTAPAAQ